MKLYSTDELRKKLDSFQEDFTLPSSVAKKYNLTHHPDPISGEELPGGRAWVMWFLDEVDKI